MADRRLGEGAAAVRFRCIRSTPAFPAATRSRPSRGAAMRSHMEASGGSAPHPASRMRRVGRAKRAPPLTARGRWGSLRSTHSTKNLAPSPPAPFPKKEGRSLAIAAPFSLARMSVLSLLVLVLAGCAGQNIVQTITQGDITPKRKQRESEATRQFQEQRDVAEFETARLSGSTSAIPRAAARRWKSCWPAVPSIARPGC